MHQYIETERAQELACSVRRENPLHELVALTALGDLTGDEEAQVRSLAELLHVQDPMPGADPRSVRAPLINDMLVSFMGSRCKSCSCSFICHLRH